VQQLKVIFDNNRANYDASMKLIGHVQLMFLKKLTQLVVWKFKMTSTFCKMATILDVKIGFSHILEFSWL